VLRRRILRRERKKVVIDQSAEEKIVTAPGNPSERDGVFESRLTPIRFSLAHFTDQTAPSLSRFHGC
jgi:hypothetical protein